jgi:hypothetical protein
MRATDVSPGTVSIDLSRPEMFSPSLAYASSPVERRTPGSATLHPGLYAVARIRELNTVASLA